jgi:negative regulator of flagellin synthesis FlgM
MKTEKSADTLAPPAAYGGKERAALSPPNRPARRHDAGSVSDRLRELNRADAARDAEPSFDAAKVEELKSAIASGTFKVDAGKVADGLIASVQEMLARKTRE